MIHPIVHFRRAALLSVLLCVAAGGVHAATVHTADDHTLTGNMVSITAGNLILSVPATQPAARAASTQATTRPAASATTSLPLDDIAQVVLREEPSPAPATPIASQSRNAPHSHSSSGGLLAAIIDSLFGSSDNTAAPTSVPPPGAAATTQPRRHPATRPAEPIHWQIMLTNGDHLHGQIEQWAHGALSLRPAFASGTVLTLSADQLTELWIATPAEQAKARALLHGTAGSAASVPQSDVAFVHKDAQTIVPVNGTALGLEHDALRFRYDGRDRRIALAKLVGVILAHPRAPAPAGLRFIVRLVNGDSLSGQWIGVNRNQLTLKTAWGQQLPLQISRVMRLNAIGGRLTYLSDMPPVRVEQVPFFGRVMPYRLDHALTGGPIRLSSGTYSKGVAVHARCILEYDLNDQFSRFRTTVGFEQPDARQGSASIRVLADGRPLYDDPIARGDQPPVPLDLDMFGVRRLTLIVDFGPEQDVQARVDWADARLLRPQAPSTQPAPREVHP